MSQRHIIIRNSNGEIRSIPIRCGRWQFSVEEKLDSPMGKAHLKTILKSVKAKMQTGERIINTNIPKELL